MDKEYIEVAFCNKPHGVRGEIKVTVYLDNNKDFKKLKSLYCDKTKQTYQIKRIFELKECYGVGFEGFTTYEQAEQLKNQKLYALKSEIEDMIDEDRIFIDDLIGLTVVYKDGTIIGEIDDIVNYGASDIVFIKSEKMKNLSFANIGGIFLDIDLDNNRVIIDREQFEKVCVYDK